jgi:polysaccharide export outer membrane protein
MRIEAAAAQRSALSMSNFLLTFVTFCCLLLMTARAVSAAGAAPEDYRVGAGDLVRVTVFGSPELSAELRISQTGSITCPLIGPVPVGGKSASEVETLLKQKYIEGGFLKQPQIAVLVVEYESQKVSVLGFVQKPGQYALRTNGNIMDMLAEAGGVIPQNAADEATLLRADGSKEQIDLDALFRGDQRQNITVLGGDRIYVPRAEQFYIYGQVQKPGMYRRERNMTVTRAISAAGGLTARGSERRVLLKRRDEKGKEKEYSARGTDTVGPDDVLFVKESLF